MVLINKAINEVTVKLVYYGPGLCGKTTNLEKIYGNPKLENKGKMISMSTETDRTLFFDFMPMELGTIAGQKVRVQLYTVPGQVFYDATRKLVLRGADGVVFVADSQNTMRDSNLDSLENLKTNLRINRIDPDKVALVFQYNKRDLPNVDSVDDMNAYLQPDGAPVVEALGDQRHRRHGHASRRGDAHPRQPEEQRRHDASRRAGARRAGHVARIGRDADVGRNAEAVDEDGARVRRRGNGGRFSFEVEPIDGAVAEEEDPFGAMVAVEAEPGRTTTRSPRAPRRSMMPAPNEPSSNRY